MTARRTLSVLPSIAVLAAVAVLAGCGRYGPPRRLPVVPDEPAAVAREAGTQNPAAEQGEQSKGSE